MEILLIHNIMWSHYKAKVFSELSFLAKSSKIKFNVIHLGYTKNNRKELGDIDLSIHQYPYKVLFKTSIDEISSTRKAIFLLKELRNSKADVIIFPGYSEFCYWVGIFYCWIFKRKTKLAITVDSTSLDHKRSLGKEKLKSLLLKLNDLVFCYGTRQIKYLKELNVRGDKIKVRVQATDNEKIRNTFIKEIEQEGWKRKKQFLYVGRFSKEKNLKMLIESFCLCSNESWELVLIGGGILKNELEQYIALKAKNNIKLLNGIPWNKLPKIYATASVFVLPSISEPWGLVVNEAMLCEMPILVSNHCGCVEDLVEEGKNGYSFNPFDLNELSSKMNLMINEPQRIKAFGKRSYQIIQKYTPQIAAKQMLEGAVTLSEDKLS